MASSSQIILVSPSAHYPSHNWPNLVALTRALQRKQRQPRGIIFSPPAEPIPADLRTVIEPLYSRPPRLSRRLAAGKWADHGLFKLISLYETQACLRRALRLASASPNPVLHFMGGSYWLVALAARRYRHVRFVYSLYGPVLSGPAGAVKARLRPHLARLLQKAVATGRLCFTGENEFVCEQVADVIGPGIHLVPYAIGDGESLPTREEARRKLDLPPQEKIILFFGTHRREKDYQTSLRGCLALPVPPLALFVGKVISANDPRQVVADCRYPKARVIDEFVPEEMARFYFAAADAVALPYEANFSRGSGVLIECCRHLRPMIASATPYFTSFLTRYPCGVTFTPGDSAAFAEAAGRVLADGGRYRSALEQARQAHAWGTVVDQYIKLYDAPAG